MPHSVKCQELSGLARFVIESDACAAYHLDKRLAVIFGFRNTCIPQEAVAFIGQVALNELSHLIVAPLFVLELRYTALYLNDKVGIGELTSFGEQGVECRKGLEVVSTL